MTHVTMLAVQGVRKGDVRNKVDLALTAVYTIGQETNVTVRKYQYARMQCNKC